LSITVAYVDDEPSNFEVIQTKLGSRFSVRGFTTKEAFLEAARAQDFDVHLIDIHLGKLNGFQLAELLIQDDQLAFTPMIFISFDVSAEAVEKSLVDFGAEYISRLMPAEEMRARFLRVVEHRVNRDIRFGCLRVDSLGMKILMDEEPLDLTLIEMRVLSYLIRMRGRKIHKRFVFRHVWGESQVAEKTLNSHLSNLRAKLGSHKAMFVLERDGMIYLAPGRDS